MKTQNEYLNVPLACYENCHRCSNPFKDAHKKLWSSNYGWAVMEDFYRWDFEGYTGQSDVFGKVKKVGTKLGVLIHTRSIVTIDDAEHLLNDDDEIEHGTFLAWASRFNNIFREAYAGDKLSKEMKRKLLDAIYPFYYLEVPNGIRCITRAAYKMRPDRTSFVITGVEPGSGYEDSQVPWHLLLEKPEY